MPAIVKKAAVDWQTIREQFGSIDKYIYLNNAAHAPLAHRVYKKGQEILEQMHTDIAHLDTLFPKIISQTRKQVADFLHAQPEDIAFTHNTSYAMNMVALRLRRLYPNQKTIVTLQDEFPSSTLPFKRLGFKLNMAKPEQDGSYSIPEIISRLSEDTAAVVASHVQFRTGARIDLPMLSDTCDDRDIPLVVNATQSAGVFPLDTQKIKAYALTFSSHKWLMAGSGAGVLYFPEHMRGEGFPPLAGWLSARNPMELNNRTLYPNKNAQSLELGFNSVIPLVCLAESIAMISEIGQLAIRERVLDLSDTLYETLKSKDARIITPAARNARAGIISILRPDAEKWIASLQEKGIYVSKRGPENVRISPHFFNTHEEIERFGEQW